jgi:hypothetical protein
MSRCRSHRLTVATIAAGLGGLALTLAACQAGPTDNGCLVTRQIVLGGTTPLPLAPEVRVDRVGAGLAVIGSDGSAVRWTAIAAAGAVAAEQAFALPPETVRASYAMAGAETPGDRVIVGVLVPAANGSDAELRFVAAPADGSPAPGPGDPVATFSGGAGDPPLVAMGTSASGMYAGAAWIDPQSGLPTYVMLDGQGQVVGGQPRALEDEPASAYTCLGFAPGKQELTVSYQRIADPGLPPAWLIDDITTDGFVSTLRLGVTEMNGPMSCARAALYDPTASGALQYAIAWQDASGSWLSVYYGPALEMRVMSFPFASSTDFGGPDTQPPIVGLAAFGNDFGVLFARPHSVELWRLDRMGNRRPGTLLLPSLEGDVQNVSAVTSPGLLSASYADLTGDGTGRRLVVDAACY